MEIPKHIKVGRKWYRINRTPSKNEGLYGRIQYELCQIHVHTHKKSGHPIKPADQQETFWHESVHAILHEMNHPLYKNEAFVKEFSHHLSKMVDSARFE